MLNHIGTITIKTPRLTLRKFRAEDSLSSFRNWSGSELTVNDIDFICHENIFQAEDFISDTISGYNDYTYSFAISLNTSNQVIGSIQLTNIDDYLEKCTVGFVVGYMFWGKGYATEALDMVLNFAFNTVGFQKVVGLCRTNNPSSEKVMKKCNMFFEGISRREIRIVDNFYDGKAYSILKDEYVRNF
ncbi:MAG: GNAT family N-acetyltransferase [Clostridiales bacterium]|jgi:ribosomal-protein-alanine N-acetyltransferase|nr:GNAT family N-acetyltransferase [Clostridiales bacterium]